MDALRGPAELYGQALAELAAEQGELELVTRDLEAAKPAFATPDLELFFGNPLAPRQAKLELIDRLFADRTSSVFHLFLRVVINRRRGRLIRDIVRAALHECLAKQGIEVVNVATQSPLPADLAEVVRESLTKALGERIYLEFRVDSTLLGGMVIRRGDRLLDASVLGVLQKIGDFIAGGAPVEQG